MQGHKSVGSMQVQVQVQVQVITCKDRPSYVAE